MEHHGSALDPEATKYDQPSKLWHGMDIIAVMEQIGVGPSTFEAFKVCIFHDFTTLLIRLNTHLKVYRALMFLCISFLQKAFNSVQEDQQQRLDNKQQVSSILTQSTLHVLGELLIVLTFVYKNDMMYLDDYRSVQYSYKHMLCVHV